MANFDMKIATVEGKLDMQNELWTKQSGCLQGALLRLDEPAQL
jgi:hypothetical protein